MTITLAHPSEASHKKLVENEVKPPEKQTADTLTDASGSDDNLDLVRNILFGEQVKQTEKRRLELERLLEMSINSLREESEKRFNGISQELSALINLLSDETKTRQSEIHQSRNALNQLAQQVAQLDSKSQKAQSELHDKITQESNKNNNYITHINEQISLKLEQAVSQLRDEKADRKAIAGLLSGVAKQLLDSDERV